MYGCVCVHVCMCGVYACMYVWVHIHVCVHACVCVRIHIVSACVCMCVCAHISNLKLITRTSLRYFSTLFPEAGPHNQTQVPNMASHPRQLALWILPLPFQG